MAEKHRVTFPPLRGGLNLAELDYAAVHDDESPQLKNLWWSGGVLRSRPGQVRLIEGTAPGVAAYGEAFHGWGFFHCGSAILCADLAAPKPEYRTIYTGLGEEGGDFFPYGECLYYKCPGYFVRIACTGEGEVPFSAGDLTDRAYVPTILLNADPASGAGDRYQSENRLTGKMRVRYAPGKDITAYRLPLQEVEEVAEVTVGGAAVDFTADLAAGLVTLAAAPGEEEEVTIVFRKDNPEALAAVMECRFGAVCGVETEVCMVLGGGERQKNAVYWNGNGSAGMEDAYFPLPCYNLCGDSGEAVTGFGRQYEQFIVLKEGSVGRLSAALETVEGRSVPALSYGEVNGLVGCDLPGTARLVENNLVFASSRQGVMMLLSASAAYENNLRCISRKVNPGLLALLARGERAAALDDDGRYWLSCGEEVYLWDYTISSAEDPSWFYFTGIAASGFLRFGTERFLLGRDGSLIALREVFSDFGRGIEKVCRFPARSFGSYDRLKDVTAVSIAVRHDVDSDITLEYETDWGTWRDGTPIRNYSYRLVPRNLARRCLGVGRFAHVEHRRPPAKAVRHFALGLYNDRPGEDLSVVSAAVEYRLRRKER
ncbi:MAG: hypothetical protein IJE22_01230 [Oscillibacter sp.]|nr:hypothetical protein [Oscillibacter sp.]